MRLNGWIVVRVNTLGVKFDYTHRVVAIRPSVRGCGVISPHLLQRIFSSSNALKLAFEARGTGAALSDIVKEICSLSLADSQHCKKYCTWPCCSISDLHKCFATALYCRNLYSIEKRLSMLHIYGQEPKHQQLFVESIRAAILLWTQNPCHTSPTGVEL